MSNATYENMEQAIAEHIADECDGALMGAYVMAVQTLDLEGDDDMMYTATHGSQITQRGLSEMLGDIYTVASEDD